jgi:4-hydroxy-tetrahydrodipicolinate synthase
MPPAQALAAEIATLRAALPDGFAIGYSGDWVCAEALLSGADTWFSVVGGVLPDVAAALTAAALAGDKVEVARIDGVLQPLWALFREFGSLRVVYAIAGLLGLTKAAPPLPILPLTGADTDRVAAALAGLD